MALLREAKPCVPKRVGFEVGCSATDKGPTRLSIGRKNRCGTGRELENDIHLSDEAENSVLSHNHFEVDRSEE